MNFSLEFVVWILEFVVWILYLFNFVAECNSQANHACSIWRTWSFCQLVLLLIKACNCH